MNWRKIARKLLFPPPLATVLLTFFSVIGLVYGFIKWHETDARRIASDALAFYALIVLCLRIPDIRTWIRRFWRENRSYQRYRNDVRLRMNVSLWGTFAWNAVYAVFQLALGVYHRTTWFYAIAGYYALLAALRLMLGRHVRAYAPSEKKRSEWRKYRLCGAGLAMMNLALPAFVINFVRNPRAMRHHEITVIALATYTFASLALAIVNIVRYRRYQSPACSAAKALSLVSAIMSMLSLENAMLSTFGEKNDARFSRIMLSVSGAATSGLIFAMAILMIVRATKQLKTGQE